MMDLYIYGIHLGMMLAKFVQVGVAESRRQSRAMLHHKILTVSLVFGTLFTCDVYFKSYLCAYFWKLPKLPPKTLNPIHVCKDQFGANGDTSGSDLAFGSSHRLYNLSLRHLIAGTLYGMHVVGY